MSVKVTLYSAKDVPDDKLAYAVIVAQSDGKWIYCRHSMRDTWEIPGGHREVGESIEHTARRELFEETGALEFTLHPVCVYGVSKETQPEDYGMLYYAAVNSLGQLPQLEIAEIQFFVQPPQRQTYPHIQPYLLQAVQAFLTKCAL